MAEYPPYVKAYNGIPTLFQKIKTAAVQNWSDFSDTLRVGL